MSTLCEPNVYAGGKFWQRFGTGVTVAGLNHLMHPWLTPSKEYSPEQYKKFSESRKAKFVERPKRALVQVDRQSTANYPTVGSGVHVENTTTTEIWLQTVYVKQKNLIQTMSMNGPITGEINGHVSTTIFYRIFNYYNSGLARDLSMLNYIHGVFNPGYHQTHVYTSPTLYPSSGLMAPYISWFNY